MSHQDIDVVSEGSDDGVIGVEFHCVWWERRCAAGNIVPVPAEEGEFTAVVVVLLLLVSFSFSVHYLGPRYKSDMRGDED